MCEISPTRYTFQLPPIIQTLSSVRGSRIEVGLRHLSAEPWEGSRGAEMVPKCTTMANLLYKKSMIRYRGSNVCLRISCFSIDAPMFAQKVNGVVYILQCVPKEQRCCIHVQLLFLKQQRFCIGDRMLS